MRNASIVSLPAAIVVSYSDAPPGRPVRVEWRLGATQGSLMTVKDEENASREFLV